MRAGRPIPAAILNAPVIGEHEQLYFTGYLELTTCRYYDGGPIPWKEIVDYVERIELGELSDIFVDVIMTTDIQWRMMNAPKQQPTVPTRGAINANKSKP